MTDDSIDEAIDQVLGLEIVGIFIDGDQEEMILEFDDGTGLLIGGKGCYLQLLDRDKGMVN